MPYLDYLANGTNSDVDLYIISVIGFPNDPLRQADWYYKACNTRAGLFLKYHGAAGLTDDPAFKQRVVAAATYPYSHLLLGSERNIGIDTAGYRVAAFLLVRVLAS